MARKGGQPGNQNAAKAKVWTAAINRALDSTKPRYQQKHAIDELAMQLIEKCYNGDLSALIELGNRLEGKPAQSLIHQGDEEGGPVRVERIKRVIADPGNTDR